MNIVKRRHASADAQQAITLFAVWWIGLAVYALAGANQDMLAAFNMTPFPLFLALRYLQMMAVCIGLWGLMYYLAFVLTGDKRVLVPLALFYAAYYAVLLFLVTRGVPASVAVEPWRTNLVFASPLLGALGIALLLVVPPLVGSGTHLLLLREAPTLAQRFRILLIVLSTLAWSISIVLRDGGIFSAAVPVGLGLLSGASISWAYAPPAWMKRRLAAPA